MKYLAAYLLLVIGGNATPSADDLSSVITAAGGEFDGDRAAALIAELEGKDIHELIAAGKLLDIYISAFIYIRIYKSYSTR